MNTLGMPKSTVWVGDLAPVFELFINLATTPVGGQLSLVQVEAQATQSSAGRNFIRGEMGEVPQHRRRERRKVLSR